jgi:hypothetical protein
MASESYSSSSSMKLLLFMVPLIIVAGLVSLLGPNPSNWAFIPNTSGDDVTTKTTTLEKTQVVVAVDVHDKEKVKAISDDSVFNQSSTPPFSVQPIDHTTQQLVREYFFFFLLILSLKKCLNFLIKN